MSTEYKYTTNYFIISFLEQETDNNFSLILFSFVLTHMVWMI